MAALWRRVFAVELLLQLAVAAAVVPSSLSAWGVATLPFALVLVLDLQAAAPAAVAEGEPLAAREAWELRAATIGFRACSDAPPCAHLMCLAAYPTSPRRRTGRHAGRAAQPAAAAQPALAAGHSIRGAAPRRAGAGVCQSQPAELHAGQVRACTLNTHKRK